MQHLDSIVNKMVTLVEAQPLLSQIGDGTADLNTMLTKFFRTLHQQWTPEPPIRHRNCSEAEFQRRNDDYLALKEEYDRLLLGHFEAPDQPVPPGDKDDTDIYRAHLFPNFTFLLACLGKDALSEKGKTFLDTTGTDLVPMNPFLFCALSIHYTLIMSEHIHEKDKAFYANPLTIYNNTAPRDNHVNYKAWKKWELRQHQLSGVLRISNGCLFEDDHPGETFDMLKIAPVAPILNNQNPIPSNMNIEKENAPAPIKRNESSSSSSNSVSSLISFFKKLEIKRHSQDDAGKKQLGNKK